jgi:hypothetical protein
MEVLILSKTHFGNNICVGGMVLSNNQYVRLLNPGGWYQRSDTSFNIGEVWEINFAASSNLKVPHTEDVIIYNQRFIRKIDNIRELIMTKDLEIWHGNVDNIFDGTLLWAQSGAGYLSATIKNYPKQSVGFWLSDKPLNFENDHYYYPVSNNFNKRKLKYKGIPSAINTIPANSLLRVSLAKWWKPQDSTIEERCYVQLSGWYDLNGQKYYNSHDEYIDDLPF